MYRFTCPPGMIFEERFKNCHDPTTGPTRPGCENMNNDVSYANEDPSSVPLIQRHRRSASPQENGNQDVFEKIENTANVTCIFIYHVDKYVTRVKSMDPVALHETVSAEEYTSIVEQYNKYLESAQDHTYVWRNGDNIMSGISRIYELSNLFAPEFQRQYQTMKKKVETLQNSTENTILRALGLDSDITNLQAENANITDMLDDADNIPKDLKRYFLSSLRKNEETIEQKELELSDMNTSIIITFKELVTFMEYVRDDASQIKVKANSTRAKVKTFKDHISQDKEAFNKSKELAKKGISNLEVQRNASLERIEGNKNKIEQAEIDRNKQKEELRQLEDEIDQELDRFQEELGKVDKEVSEALRQVHNRKPDRLDRISCIITGMRSDDDAKRKVQLLLQEKNSTFTQFKLKQQQFESMVTRREQEIDQYNQEILSLNAKVEDENKKLDNLRFVDGYLETVIGDTSLILPFITRALNSLKEIEDIFDDIVRNLEALIYKAKSAKEEVETRNIAYVIYEGVSGMKSKWDASNSRTIILDKCADTGFFHSIG